jgi:hypothetical protein
LLVSGVFFNPKTSLDFINTFLGIFIEKYLFLGIFRKRINNKTKSSPPQILKIHKKDKIA